MPSARLMDGTEANYAPAVIDGPPDRLSDTLRVDVSDFHGVGFLKADRVDAAVARHACAAVS